MVLVLFVAVIAVLPWLLRRWQQRQIVARGAQGVQTQVLSTTALSPSQRIVVVEVGQGSQRTRLVLGVTAQNIQCLHVLADSAASAPSVAATVHAAGATPQVDVPTFAGTMEQLQRNADPPGGTH